MTTQTTTRPFGILFVDDEGFVLDFAGAFARALGFAAFGARSGREAERLLRERAGEIDAAVIDLRMPGLDGIATGRLLREARADLPCCLMSGMGLGDLPPPEGFRCVLDKPFSPAQLQDCIADLRA